MAWAREFSRLIALALLMTGCQSTYYLDVDTTPSGATVWENAGTVSYRTPNRFHYPSAGAVINPETGCKIVRGFSVQWESGAIGGSANNIELCGNGNVWHIVYKRPDDAPGLEIDIAAERAHNSAIILAQQRALEEQIRQDRLNATLAPAANVWGHALGCAIAGGGCPSASRSSYVPHSPTQYVPQGPTQFSTDSFGTTTGLVKGEKIRLQTDAFGNTMGEIGDDRINCWTDDFGTTSCR